MDNIQQIVSLVISLVPTVLFVLVMLFGALRGFRRGLRKSTILFVHAIAVTIICLILFLICVKSEAVDKAVLELINSIMGSEHALQESLGASYTCETLREVLIDAIPVMLNVNDGFTLVIEENAPYLLTLVNLIYHLVFAIVFWIIHYILIFILYLVYLIFYPDRRKKKKIAEKVLHGKLEHTFQKRRLAGALVGACRGALTGLIILSFLGSTLYTFTGTSGEEKMPDVEFGDETIDMVYDIYNEVNAYGSQGIFKVLNLIKDNEDTPYYLFAADLVFSGNLKDENYGINENIVFREEFGAYVGFAKDTLTLILQYYDGEPIDLIKGTEDATQVDLILDVFENAKFQKDFEKLIDDFNSPTYFKHFVCSFINSFAGHLDEVGFTQEMSPELVDILSILFTEGYLSESIPYEKELLDERNKTEDFDNSKYYLDTLDSSVILNKNNIKAIYKIILKIMAYNTGEELSNEETIELLHSSIDLLRQVSLFNPDYSDELNGVYRRLFAYVENNLLNNLLSSEESELSQLSIDNLTDDYYISEEYENVDWCRELNNLLLSVEDLAVLYVNIFLEETEVIDVLFRIYDTTDPNYSDNVRCFESLIDCVGSSYILSMVLSSDLVMNAVNELFISLSPTFQFPYNIKFANTLDKNGSIVEYGELHSILNSIKIIISNDELKELILGLADGSTEFSIEMLSTLIGSLTSGEEPLLDSLLESRIMCSLLSSFILESFSTGSAFEIYVDESMLEKDNIGNKVNIIKQEELSLFFNNLTLIYDLIEPLLESQEINFEDISSLLKDERLLRVLDSKIVEGTLSKLLINNIGNIEMLIIPQEMVNGKGLVSTSTKDSEIKILIKVLQATDIDIFGLLSPQQDAALLSTGDQTNDILNVIKEISEEELVLLFESNIIYYSISNLITTNASEILPDLTIIIPTSAKTKLTNELIEYVIKRDILVEFFVNVLDLIPADGEFEINDIIRNLMQNMDLYVNNPIIAPTLVNYLVNSTTFVDSIEMPTSLKNDASMDKLLVYSNNNLWREELKDLLNMFDELFDLSGGNDINFDSDVINSKLEEIITTWNQTSRVNPSLTKLELVYESYIASCNITTYLYDFVLTDQLIDNDVKYNAHIYDSTNNIIRNSEIKSLIEATEILDLDLTSPSIDPASYITKINDLSSYERQSLYESYLLKGILTKAIGTVIDNSNGVLKNPSLAYETDIHVFKNNEVDALLKLLSQEHLLDALLNNTGNIDFNMFDFNLLKELVYDKTTGNIPSYLVLYSLSSLLEGIVGIYIPSSVYHYNKYTNEGYILPLEIVRMIDGINALDIKDFNIEITPDNFTFPNSSNIRIIGKSEILRASVSKMLKVNGEDSSVTIMVEDNDLYRITTTDYQGNRLTYLTETEFDNFFISLNYLFEGEEGYEFTINNDTIKSLASKSNLELTKILGSNIIILIVNDYLDKGIKFDTILGSIIINYQTLGYSTTKTYCFNLSTETRVQVNKASESDIKSTILTLALYM